METWKARSCRRQRTHGSRLSQQSQVRLQGTRIYASHSFADPEHVTTDVLHQSQLSSQTNISSIQVTAANQTPSQTMVTEVVNTPEIWETNLSVDTVQVQNNDAEQLITIADNALDVTNASNGLEKKTKQQAQPSVSQITNDDTVKIQAGSTQQQPVVIVRQVQMQKTYSGNTSWKCYKEHFERIAAINGWITNAEKVPYDFTRESSVRYSERC